MPVGRGAVVGIGTRRDSAKRNDLNEVDTASATRRERDRDLAVHRRAA
jgi:hypothetical protein